MLIIPKAVITHTGRGEVGFMFDPVFDPEVEAESLKGKPVHLTISRPVRQKKTGEGSRLNLVHLWFREIADALTDPEHEVSEEQVKEAMKRMSVDEGWPTCLNPLDGKEEPVSMAWASEDHMAIIVKVTELFAMLNSIPLSQEETK